MSNPRRRDEKKQRRQKRVEKRGQRQREHAAAPMVPVLDDVIRHLKVPEPGRWPGGCDATLARPDMVKFRLAEFATKQPTGRRKLYELKHGLESGLIGFLSELDTWAIEEFLWHGLPGDGWEPIEQFLASPRAEVSASAAEQLRLWKQARIGLFEIGPVVDDTMVLQEWDALAERGCGEEFRALSLNIGGVNLFRDAEGRILLSYLSPWAPAENLYCAMGYSLTVPKDDVELVLPYLGLQHAELVSRPLPWKVGWSAAEEHQRQWQERAWHGWLAERLRFPFAAVVNVPPRGKPEVRDVLGLLPSTPEQAHLLGIYFQVDKDGETLASGGTTVTPLDVTSPNRLALAEYHAYREWAGPPRGVSDLPDFLELQ